MSKKIRWGILGAGHIAHSFVGDFKVITNASLVAVAAGEKNRAKIFADTYSLPFHYNYDELYNSTEVDAVYIATTHNFHFEQCKQCLLHGKSVLCEKPITLNDRELRQLVEIANKQGVFLMEAMWTWFLPPVLVAKQWLTEGRIGTLKFIDAGFGVPMEKKLEGRLYNRNLAGGALLDLGVYPVAISTFFSGRMPEKITASGRLAETGVDESIGMILQYNDLTASIYTSMVNIMPNQAVLCGDLGYIVIPDFYKATSAFLYDSHHKLLEQFNDDRTTKGFNFEIQHATNCIAGGNLESDVVTHEKSLMVQQIMTEVRRQVGVVYPGE